MALALGVVVVVLVAAVTVLLVDAGSESNVSSQMIRLSVTLFIPAAILIAYWYIARRQVRSAKPVDDAPTKHQGKITKHEGDVVSRVSHELRDRLTVLYGFSETLLDSELSDQTELRDTLTVINTEAVDLTRIVDDLVAATELQSGDVDVSLQKFDPSDEVERVVLPFRRRGSEISIDCWSGTAVSDPIRFRQIMRSLLSNAVKHGGPEIGVVGEISGNTFRCTVADDGDGISSYLEMQLFGASSDSVLSNPGVDGTGLGLGVAQALARQLDGRLTYDQSSDLTMVTLVLPTRDWPDAPVSSRPVDDTPEDPEESPESSDEPSGSSRPVERLISFTNDGEQETDTIDEDTAKNAENGARSESDPDDDSEVLAAVAETHTSPS